MVVWQSSQLLPLAMWLGFLPRAIVLLWQLLQAPSTSAWSTRTAGDHRVTLWQVSQLVLLVIWLLDLPVAVVPLWQLMQLPVIAA